METLELSRAELWFCAPDTPAIGEARVFELQLASETLRTFARLVPSRLAPIQGERKAYELFLQRESGRGLTAVLKRDGTLYGTDEERADQASWGRHVNNSVLGGTSRIWQLENDTCFAITLGSAKRGEVWRHEDSSSQRSRLPFQWDARVSVNDFDFWPQSDLNAFCVSQFADNASQLRRACDWQDFNMEERTAHVAHCENSTWEQLISLAQAVLTSNGCGDTERDWGFAQWYLLLGYDRDFHDDVLHSWHQTLANVFRPFYLRKDIASFEKEHLKHLWSLLPRHFDIYPSAHEKLEAFLLLRDWLRANAPDDEERLMGLFPPLSA